MVETCANTGALCPDPQIKYDVDVREFVVLAFIHDYRRAKPAQIGRAVGLSRTTVSRALSALIENGLIRPNGVSIDEYALTFDGVALVRKAACSSRE
jgi:DNA-binding MarR family transcriptional regulator